VRRTQLFAAAIFVVLGLAAIFVVIPRAVVDAPTSGGLPPSFMPYVAAALATLAALGWLAGELRALRAAHAAHTARAAPESPTAPRADWRFAAAAAGVLGASFLLMSTAGYLAGGAALVAGTLALARAKLVTVVVAAIVAPLALWVLFVHFLATPLP